MTLVLLLPPSEGKTLGGTARKSPNSFGRLLAKERQSVMDAVGTLFEVKQHDAIAKSLGVRGALLDRAVESYAQLVSGTAPLLPAWQRYSGVVWSALDPSTLERDDLQRVLVPSALYGLTTAVDHIADYRLTFKVSLPGIGNLSRFWSPALTRALSQRATSATIIDLLPSEHSAALDFDSLMARHHVVRISFHKSGGNGAAGHGAKSVKGLLARHILTRGLDHLERFETPRWRVIQRGSTVQVWEVDA